MKNNELNSDVVINAINNMKLTNEDFQRICKPKSWTLKTYLNYLNSVEFLRVGSHKREHADNILREYTKITVVPFKR
jgi:hypothetical protein